MQETKKERKKERKCKKPFLVRRSCLGAAVRSESTEPHAQGPSRARSARCSAWDLGRALASPSLHQFTDHFEKLF